MPVIDAEPLFIQKVIKDAEDKFEAFINKRLRQTVFCAMTTEFIQCTYISPEPMFYTDYEPEIDEEEDLSWLDGDHDYDEYDRY